METEHFPLAFTIIAQAQAEDKKIPRNAQSILNGIQSMHST